jgi:4,5-dihydroxyphthalate decarboxylase
MADIDLTLACWDYDRTRPLIDGRVKPEGIRLDVTVLRPRQIFPRMLEGQEFDASEISLASHASLVGRGSSPFVAIPVVVSKIFRHSCIYVRADSGIQRPEDLRGKRVGTTQISSTAVVFINGMLEDEYGVRQEEMRWFMGGLDSSTQRPLIPLDLPEEVQLEFLPEGRTLEGMLEAGELDALFSIYLPTPFLQGSPSIRRLFPDFRRVEEDYFNRTGIFPVMHTVALRRELHEEHPWVAQSLYDAFARATALAQEQLYDTDALRVALPWLIDHVEETRRVFGDDYWRHGFQANRPAWEAIGRYVHNQGISPRPVAADELFLPDFVRATAG